MRGRQLSAADSGSSTDEPAPRSRGEQSGGEVGVHGYFVVATPVCHDPVVGLKMFDDTFAPEHAYAFHAMLRARAEVGELPPWPGTPRQLALL